MLLKINVTNALERLSLDGQRRSPDGIQEITRLSPVSRDRVAVYDDEGSRLWQVLLAPVDQNKVPNNLLVSEPSLSTQRIGGRCGR
jgi:hypothetical protein